MPENPEADPEVERLTVTEARLHFGNVINGVKRDKKHVILERHGFPVAALIDIEVFEACVGPIPPEKPE